MDDGVYFDSTFLFSCLWMAADTLEKQVVYDNLKRGQIIIKKGATADAAKLTK